MGKATRWLKGLLDKIRPDPTPTSDSPSRRPFPKEKRRWGLVKCSTVKSSNSGVQRVGNSLQTPPASNYEPEDAGKHAIAVAAASAAAAEAAVAAAQAAAAVVRLTVSGRCYPPQSPQLSIAGARESWSAIVIQSHFRGYLAKRALKALKGLVKLQALVRGHIMRKKTAETMRSIEAMLRAQARARRHRAYESPNSSDKSSQIYHHHGPPTPESFEKSSYNNYTNNIQSPMSNGSGSRSVTRVIIHPDKGYQNSSGWSESRVNDSKWRSREKNTHHRTTASFSNQEEYYYRPDKILEIDPGKPPRFIKNRGINYFDSSELEFASDQMSQQTTIPSPNINQIKKSTQNIEDDEIAFCTPENSPQFYSVSSRGGASSSSRRQSPMTPTKSDTSGASGMSGYSDCPSYMAYTESSRAKMRSLSVPRQRPQQCNEKTSSAKRWSVHQQTVVSNAAAAMEARYASKGYVGSGGLDRLGMPVRNNGMGYYSGCLN